MPRRTYKEVWNEAYAKAEEIGFHGQDAVEIADAEAQEWCAAQIDRADDERHERKLWGKL